MNKEIYEKPKAEVVLFDLEEVYMVTLLSANGGENSTFKLEEDAWNV